jgi:hypothetical protein
MADGRLAVDPHPGLNAGPPTFSPVFDQAALFLQRVHSFVPGLVPGIHVFDIASKGVDGRDKRGHERSEGRLRGQSYRLLNLDRIGSTATTIPMSCPGPSLPRRRGRVREGVLTQSEIVASSRHAFR